MKEPTLSALSCTNSDALISVTASNPFDRVQGFHDKDGVLCFMTFDQYLEECAKPNNRFKRTTFGAVMPVVCLALGFLLLCVILGTSTLLP